MDKSFEKELERGKSYCARLLSLRPRTEKEIDTRLEGRGFSPALRGRILLSLKKAGLVDDLVFAKEWIDSRTRTSPRGRSLLAEELRKKGVSPGVIEQALSGSMDDLDERSLAAGLVKKHLQKTGQRDIKLKAKLFRLLVSRGFDPELAEEVINELIF